MTWPSRTCVGGQRCTRRYLCLSHQSQRDKMNNFQWESQIRFLKLQQGSLDKWQKQHRDSKMIETYRKMTTWWVLYLHFLCIYSINSKKKNLCTSECFKASCVGEDRKSFHQLATDSVWEIFASRCTLKTFSFQHLTTANINIWSEVNRVFILFTHWTMQLYNPTLKSWTH